MSAAALAPAVSVFPKATERVGAVTHRKAEARRRQIVCFGGPSLNRPNAPLNEYVLSLAANERPRVCLLASESGELGDHVGSFYRYFPSGCCQPSHLFASGRRAASRELGEELLRQDVIYVGGGRLIGVLNRWRLHDLDAVLRRAWRNGAVLCGFRAGALCWFTEAVTSFNGGIRAARGLGLLPWSACVHYRHGWARRAAYRSYVHRGMRPGFAIEEGVALHFVGTRLAAALSSRPDGRAFRVEAREGRLTETPLPVTDLTSAREVRRWQRR